MYVIVTLRQQLVLHYIASQVYLGTFGKYIFGVRRACFVLHYIVQFPYRITP